MDKDAYIKQLEAENAALRQQIQALELRLDKMQKHIDQLGRRLGINSQNSSKPPSTDPPGNSPAPKRNRKKRGVLLKGTSLIFAN